MHRGIFCGVRGDVAAAQSRGARAVVRAVPGRSVGDADRDLARVAATRRVARVQRYMSFKNPCYSLVLLCLGLLLSGCKQQASVAPPSPTPEQAAAASPSPSPTPPRPTGPIEFKIGRAHV